MGMTIDELARRAGTTSRNVRAYQERGLLPPPERSGRVGVYGEGHLARLRLIANLTEKGFSLASIGALLQAWERGHSIRDLLEVEEAVTAVNEAPPVVVTLDQLAEQFGGADTEATTRAAEHGLLEILPTEDGTVAVRVNAPELLEIGAELVQVGIPIGAVVDEAGALLADATRIADRFVGLFTTHVVDPFLDEGLSDAELRTLAEKVRAARPLAARAVERALARAMNLRLADEVGRIVEAEGNQADEAATS
jgi:DNA-binding transcriptional MerR regulator